MRKSGVSLQINHFAAGARYAPVFSVYNDFPPTAI
jgi:hypothetical protein